MPAVSTVMHKHVVAVAPSTRLYAALKLIKVSGVPLLPVIKDGKLKGIVTRSRLEKSLDSYSDDTQVSEIMSKPVFAEISADIDSVAALMIKRHMPRLPVVSDKKSMVCVGIVSSTDIVAVKNLPKKES